MARLYCPKCQREETGGGKFCPQCGSKLIPNMRVVIMPFVESGQETELDPRYRQLVEWEGGLRPAHCIGCQMYIASDVDSLKLTSTRREEFFLATGKMLPHLVKSELDAVGFYEVPDVGSVEAIAEAAGDMPTELFLLIQEKLDPDFLFLPEVNCFLFRYPHPYGKDEASVSGFAYVQLSAFLLDNRQNRIVSRGSGAGLARYLPPPGVQPTEETVIELDRQMQSLKQASSAAVREMLSRMKMI
jgi:hypothetical protein